MSTISNLGSETELAPLTEKASDEKASAKRKRRQGKFERQRTQIQNLLTQLDDKDCKIQDLKTKLNFSEELNKNLNLKVAESEVRIVSLEKENLKLQQNVQSKQDPLPHHKQQTEKELEGKGYCEKIELVPSGNVSSKIELFGGRLSKTSKASPVNISN